MNDGRHKLLDDIYFKPDGSAGSFSSAIPLYKQAKKLDKTITLKTVKKYLESNPSYLLHKRVVRKYPKRKIFKIVPNESWSVDTIFYYKDAGSNNSKTCALTVVDYFSHRGYAKVLANKSAQETLRGFRAVIEDAGGVKPRYLLCDEGKEFDGVFLAFLKAEKIQRIHTKYGQKAFNVEILNNVVKQIVERILSYYRNRKWVKSIEQAIRIYNSTEQAALLNNSPLIAEKDPDVIAQLQAYYFRQRRLHADKFKNEKPAFTVGQTVKIIEHSSGGPFGQKVTKNRFSDKNYVVDRVVKGAPLSYRLKSVNKLFYKQELTAADSDEVLRQAVKSNNLLGILSHKKFAIKFLRSGKPIEFEVRYLVKQKGKEEPFYLTKEEILGYDNGEELYMTYSKDKQNE